MIVLIGACIIAFVVVVVLSRILYWVYITPTRLEKSLKKQGLKGNSYRIVYGDLKDMLHMIHNAKNKPINLDDDIKQRVLPFIHTIFQKYGMYVCMYAGCVCVHKNNNVLLQHGS